MFTCDWSSILDFCCQYYCAILLYWNFFHLTLFVKLIKLFFLHWKGTYKHASTIYHFKPFEGNFVHREGWLIEIKLGFFNRLINLICLKAPQQIIDTIFLALSLLFQNIIIMNYWKWLGMFGNSIMMLMIIISQISPRNVIWIILVVILSP